MTAAMPTFPSRGRAMAVALVSVIIVGAVLGGAARLLREDEHSSCSDAVAAAIDEEAVDAPVVPLLIDVVSNEDGPAVDISRSFHSVLLEGVRRGSAFELVLDRGPRTALARDECLDGRNVFLVRRVNPTRQAKDERDAVDALERHITSVITSDEILDPGGPTRLIVEGAAHAGALQRQGRAVGGVFLWSDWLSANPDECLYVDGEGNRSLIASVVERCRRSIHGLPTYTADLELLGVGSGNRSAGLEAFARDLASSVCVELGRCRLP